LKRRSKKPFAFLARQSKQSRPNSQSFLVLFFKKERSFLAYMRAG
jgi:hypothetical protein